MRKLFVVAVFLVAVLLSGQFAWSQVETGSINGIVTDSTGAVIPGATVTAKSVNTGAERSVKSGAAGDYLIQNLLPGLYDVTANSAGLAPFTGRVEVTVGGKATLDAQLSVGKTTAVVEVVGAGGTTVNTQSQELSQIVDTTQMADLPSLNRNAYDFVALSGNVSNADNTSITQAPDPLVTTGESLTARGVGYSINGQRSAGTDILLDGVENVGVFVVNAGQTVPIDAIQEFSVITNNFSADYGRASGGIVNVDTKAGTNNIHGSAWEFNRLSAYTANTFNNEINGVPKGSYVRNQPGFAVGGPFVKNKLFAFFSEEFTRVRSNAQVQQEILDPSFVALLPSNVQSYFSTFGTGALPASGQVVTVSDLAAASSPVVIGPINGITPLSPSQPVFDVVNFRAPFNAGGGVPQNTNDMVGRLDYNLDSQNTMFFRVARYTESEFPGSVSYSAYPKYDVGGANDADSFLYSYAHQFSTNLLSTTKLSYTRYNVLNSYNSALTFTPNLYMSASSYTQATDPTNNKVIQMPGLENTADGSGGLPFGGPQNTIQVLEDVAWTKGQHSMRFGGALTYIQLNVAYGAYNQANEVLGSNVGPALNNLVNNGGDQSGGVFASPVLSFTARVNAEGALPCTTDIFGNPPAVPPASCTVTPPLPAADPARSYRYKDWDLYAMDSFKITRRLTLNYGLRYEHYGVQHNNHASLDSNFYPGAGTYPENIRDGGIFLTQQSPVGQFWEPVWGTAAPRVGFAYDLTGDGKTSIRGGFGISYERNFGNVTYNASFNPPASAVLSDACTGNSSGIIGANCPYFITSNDLGPLGEPGPPTALTPVELRYDGAHINVAQTQFWSLDLQRELAPSTVVDISYSGAHGVHLYDLNNVNLIGASQALLGDPLVSDPACPYSNPTNGDAECYTRPNSQYAAINERGSYGSSAYHALDIKFQTNNIHHTGLTLITNYTWAHSLDDLSSTFSESETQASLGYTNFQHPLLDWGNSDFDIRHRIVVSPIWNTPWYKEGRGFLAQALGGWTVSSIFTARSGIPFSIYDESSLLNFYVIPRLTPTTAITDYHTGTPVQQAGAGNTFFALNVPMPANQVPIAGTGGTQTAPYNPVLGISDFGPYPANMTHRNAFRGPGAWNDDLAIAKNFKLTERFNLQFRAEGFNVFNHHNFYVNGFGNYYVPPIAQNLTVVEEKGGLGSGALGGDYDERRFGQFSLRLSF